MFTCQLTLSHTCIFQYVDTVYEEPSDVMAMGPSIDQVTAMSDTKKITGIILYCRKYDIFNLSPMVLLGILASGLINDIDISPSVKPEHISDS